MSSVVFDYDAQPKDRITCPVCGRDNGSHPQTDRFGFQIGVSDCLCGLTYLNPRMTAEAYMAFYQGPYRALVRHLNPAGPDADTLDAIQTLYGSTLGGQLRRASVQTGVDFLDAGGSTGALAEGLTSVLPMTSVTVLDPSAEELGRAERRGFCTLRGTLEDPPACGLFGAIVCAKTADHLLDPLAAFRWLRAHGSGWFFVDIVDSPWKIDHPLYWSPRSLKTALTVTGWTVKATWRQNEKRFGVLCV